MIKETMEFLSQYDPEVGATIEKENEYLLRWQLLR